MTHNLATGDEEGLVRRAQSGDREAFGTLVKEHMKLVYDFSFRMTGSHADADEVAQETFVRAYAGLERFVPGTRLRAWLLTIAANLARDMHRKKAIRREVSILESDTNQESSPLEIVLQEEREALVHHALASLPVDLRAVLVLHAMEEVSLADIARMTDTPEGTIRWRFFEARRRFREKLGGTPLALEEE